MLKIRIAEAKDFSDDVIQYLKEFAEVDNSPCEQNDLKHIFKEYDVFWFRLGFRITADLMTEGMRCRIVATPVTGIDHIDEEACSANGVKIISLRGERDFLEEVRATAEMTIALTLAVMRNVIEASNDVLKGNWRRDRFRGFEIYKKTVGIIGLGRLGVITAEYFNALGAKVIGNDVSINSVPDFVQIETDMNELIKKSDIISIHVQYDETTHHLIDETAFNNFNNKKWLINTSRGGIVDEAAFLRALVEKRIAGAGIDVVQNEHNFNDKNPLLQYARENKNLVILPHIGGNTYESFEKTEWFIAEHINKEVKTWQF